MAMLGKRLAILIFFSSSSVSPIPRMRIPPVAVNSTTHGVSRLISPSPLPTPIASADSPPWTSTTVPTLSKTPGPRLAAKGMAANPS